MDPTWTDVVGVLLIGAQLLVLIAAAVVAWHQVREAQRLREDQSRPFVVIDIDVEGIFIYLKISNLGMSLARDVRFEIDPPLSSAVDSRINELKILSEGTPTLAPGKVIRFLFDSGIERKPEKFPDVYRVVVRYTDQERRRTFQESMNLDVGIYWNLTTIDRKDVHDLHERLKDIREVLKKWTSHNGALRQVSPGEDRAETRRRRREVEALRKKRTMAAGGEGNPARIAPEPPSSSHIRSDAPEMPEGPDHKP